MIKLHEIKSITALALPLMAAFLAQKGMQFIDTFMMGWIGPEALAAGAMGTSLYFTILVFCMGTLSAVGIFIVRAKGAEDVEDIKCSLLHGLYLALFLSLPCMLIIWFSPYILIAIGEDPLIVKNALLLLHALVWGFPGFLLFLVLREFISAFSLTRVIMFVALGSIPLTFLMNDILIYGKYGFPRLGIAGIGYSGAFVMWFMFLCLFLYTKKNVLLKYYVSFHSLSLNRSKTRDLLYIGIPSGLLFILESGMFLSAVVMMGYFGVNALAAHQIAMQCASIAYAIPFALSMATALQVGHAMGAKNIVKAQRAAFLGLAIGFVFSILIAIIFIFGPDQLVSLFLQAHEKDYQAISQLSLSFLMMAALFQCLDGAQAIANGALRGLKDTLIPMLLSIGCYWVIGIGSAYYFSFYTRLQALGIWYGLSFGLSSIGIILILRLLNRLKFEKRNRKIVKR